MTAPTQPRPSDLMSPPADPQPAPRLVAVTGATGFVGACLVRQLAEAGLEVRILTRRMPTSLPKAARLELVLGDLDDAAALRKLVAGADALVHVAGIIKARHARDFQAVNVEGTRHVAEALTDAAPRIPVVHVSSLAARAPHLSPYAASKRGSEQAMASIASRQPLTVIRPPAVYGPGDIEILPMFRAAAAGLCPVPAASGARLSLIHVQDLATAIAAALKTPPRHPLYEIDDGHAGGYSWPEIATALSQALERPVRSFRLPRPVMTVVAAAVEGHRSLGGPVTALCFDKLGELYHPDWVASGPRLEAETSWRPAFALAEGFRDTIAGYRAAGWLRPMAR